MAISKQRDEDIRRQQTLRARHILCIGRGHVGQTFYQRLKHCGLDVAMSPGRALDQRLCMASDILLLCVPDSAIESTLSRLPQLAENSVVMHHSGAHGLEIFEDRFSHCAVVHPLMAIRASSLQTYENKDDTDTRVHDFSLGTCVYQGSNAYAKRHALALIEALGSHPVCKDVHGHAYHAACALLAVSLPVSLSLAQRVLCKEGLDESSAQQALLGLMRSILSNMEAYPLADALSGPIVRGDAITLNRHKQALHSSSPEALKLYDYFIELVRTQNILE